MENLRNRARQQSGQTLGGPPPGGPEAWNRQRYGGGDGGGKGPFSDLGGNIGAMIERIRERQQQNQQMAQSGQRPQQQTGMAGLGQAAGKGLQMLQARALREGPKR